MNNIGYFHTLSMNFASSLSLFKSHDALSTRGRESKRNQDRTKGFRTAPISSGHATEL